MVNGHSIFKTKKDSISPFYKNLPDFFDFLLLEPQWIGDYDKKCAFGALTISAATAFGPKNCDRSLKLCMQPLIVIIYTNQDHNSGSAVNNLHFDFENWGKYQLVHSNSFILS